MKKGVLTVVALGVISGVIAGCSKKGLAEADSAALLLPKETFFFLEIPNIEGSQTRWKETSISKILNEPEVKSFLERPLAQIFSNAEFNDSLQRLKTVDFQSAFVAMTNSDFKTPFGVAGFTFKGPKTEVEGLINRAKESLKKGSGKSELIKHGNFEIEAFSDNDVTIAYTLTDTALFISNNVETLKQTLDRSVKPDAALALAGKEEFKKAFAKLPQTRELVGYLDYEKFADQLTALSATSGTQFTPEQLAEMKKLKAGVGSVSFEGSDIREFLYILAPGAQQTPALQGSSLALTNPSTILYLASGLQLQQLGTSLKNSTATNPMAGMFLAGLEETLKAQGLSVDQIETTFGPEAGVALDWTPTAQIPTLVIGIDVKDEATGKKFADLAFSTGQRDDVGSVPVWTFAIPGNPSFAPAGAFTGNGVLIGSDRQSIVSVLDRAGKKEPSIADSPAFKEAFKSVVKPKNILGFVDTKTLVERAYGTARPMIQMFGAFSPGAAAIDFNKLPTTEAIAKHLTPTAIAGNQDGEGFTLESRGSLPAYTALTVTAGATLGTVAFQQMKRIEATTPRATATPDADKQKAEADSKVDAPAGGVVEGTEGAPKGKKAND